MLFNCQFAMSLSTLFLAPTLNKNSKTQKTTLKLIWINIVQKHTMLDLDNCQIIIYALRIHHLIYKSWLYNYVNSLLVYLCFDILY